MASCSFSGLNQTELLRVIASVLKADLCGGQEAFTQERVVLNGVGTWAVPEGTLSYTIRAQTVTGSPTFTDPDGNVTGMMMGDVISYGSTSKSSQLTPGAIVTSTVGDRIVITFSRMI